MDNILIIIIGNLIPLLGTTLGAAMAFALKKEISPLVQKALLGFASGVMIAASFWSLLLPSIEMAEQQGVASWLPAAIGFLLGIGFLLLLDNLIPHLHLGTDEPEGKKSKLHKSAMLTLGVTLHNIPEGMAVGVVFAGLLTGNTTMSVASAFALAIGIALQNIPEGAIVSMSLVSNGVSRKKAFVYGMLSGVAEPMGAVLIMFLTAVLLPVQPYILSFAAGAMIYIVVEQLIPNSHVGEHSNIGTIGVAVGFVLMMILDIVLG